ncbi:hypothetical protein ACIB24_11150 [Spongisporangium articulatum]|uniref:Acyl carrier protein n=1 Tax=Spongisporangium articulatum TaxID=3362603 RepID=A0ABW8AMK3_9ACTN
MSATVTDDELIGFVRGYVRDNGLVDEAEVDAITVTTTLDSLGLDSIGTAEMLLGARAELVAAGRISPDATLLDLPVVTTVGDLGGLLRALEG